VKIAIVKLSAMGDIVHAMVALQFIKKRYPDSQIDWIVEEGFRGVLESNPDIDTILTVNLKSIKKKKSAIFTQAALLREYAKNDYDIIIDAQGLIKSAIVSRLLRRKKGCIIAGFDRESIRERVAARLYDRTVHIPYDQNTIDRNVKVLTEPLGIEAGSADILAKEPFLFTKSSFERKGYIVLVVGSTWESRNYPREKFLEIAAALGRETIVVWGSEEEHGKALWLSERSGVIEAAPKGNLELLKAIIANASLVIGNDTGPTHMAWGMNIPSITIFGPTPVNRIYITDINKAVKSPSKVDHYRLDRNDFSIRDIDPAEIITLARGLIDG